MIVDTHVSLLHAGQSKTFEAVNDRYYGVTNAEVKYIFILCRS